MNPEPTRLYCECAFDNNARAFEALLKDIDMSVLFADQGSKTILKKLQERLDDLRKQYDAHVKEYVVNRTRSLIALSAIHTFNPPNLASNNVAQVCAYSHGAIREAREVPKRKSRKRVPSAAAVSSSSSKLTNKKRRATAVNAIAKK